MPVVVPVMARIRHSGRQGDHGEEGGGNHKPCFRHLGSPEISLKTRHFWQVRGNFLRATVTKTPGKKSGKQATLRQFLAPGDA
jgi:hypothetical protein